ncbi:La protein 1 [Linum grandiflorum]
MAIQSLDENIAKEVLRQVEFYFSDSNLPRDKFLTETVTSSEDGMVSLALICSFAKMRGYLKLGEAKPDDVTEDTLKAVAEVLAKSASVKLSEDGKKVGRVSPLMKPEELVEQLDGRTVAVSPLPFDANREAVRSFFSQYGTVNSVRLPNHFADRKVFSGTALVEFSADEEAENVLGQSLTFAGTELELKPKKEFDAERAQKAEEFKAANPQWKEDHQNKSSPKENYPKGLIVAFKLKSLSTGEQAEQNKNGESVKSEGTDTKPEETLPSEESQEKAPEDANSKVETAAMDTENVGEGDKEKESEDKQTKPEEDEEPSKDAAVEKNVKKEGRFDLAACKEDKNVVLREDLKVVFGKFGNVKYIDFQFGEDSGFVRFEHPEGAQKARAAAVLAEEEGLIVKNFVATLEPVTGEAEKDYWNRVRDNQDRHKDNRGRGGRFHHRGGGKRRDNDSGRGRGRNKFQKVGA